MVTTGKDVTAKKTKNYLSTILYVGSALVGAVGIALLVNNIIMFKTTVEQYVAQGYPAETVMESLVPAQLLPGIFEAIAVYGGIALLLFGLGKAYKAIRNFFDECFCEEILDEEDQVENYFDVFAVEETVDLRDLDLNDEDLSEITEKKETL